MVVVVVVVVVLECNFTRWRAQGTLSMAHDPAARMLHSIYGSPEPAVHACVARASGMYCEQTSMENKADNP